MSRPALKMRSSSLPVPLGDRNWNGFVLGAVCTTVGIATWSFVVGTSSAYYLDAKMGAAAMLAGGIIGQLLITLATVPASTKYGLETVTTTKPQLGVRGSYIALFFQYATALGWNTVLMIFFGRAAGSVLEILGVIPPGARETTSTLIAGAGVVLVWVLVSRGSRSLKKIGPVVAILTSLLTIYLLYVLLSTYGVTAIANAEPLEPWADRLVNYTSVVELLIASTWGWWSYMGGIVRMTGRARKAILPSMIGLGVAWVLVGIVSLYAALVTGEGDPTIWAPELAGPAGGIAVLVFVAFANITSPLVGAFIATLGLSQLPHVNTRIGWKPLSALVLLPMFVTVLLFGNAFYDNVDAFMAFLGLMIAPMVGIQLADWYLLRRIDTLRVASLFDHSPRSAYWYTGGFNIAGIAALLLGSATYIAIMNPVTYEPHTVLFKYTTASLPAVLVGAVVYAVLSRLMYRDRADDGSAKEPAER
ncbi:cytosine permease [Spiractinospora alimapuensis]|uniref:cytosine permease n=1 Tax=Spiractinospora alimapuensis TaxID=2820884 RepID=UPI001F459530|nr:cytosine permease [Spiractinospora alimapuensis]QVQ50056.1 cytosine permease [Spiractinospora alimapuensis]